jgi:Family of unknown function (DUF6364)
VAVNITLSIDEKIVERARERLRAHGKTVNQEIRDHLEHLAGREEDVEAEVEAFRQRAGQGNSDSWKWNREELYDERLTRPRAQSDSPQDQP